MPPFATALEVGETAIKALAGSSKASMNLSATEGIVAQAERLGLRADKYSTCVFPSGAQGPEWIHFGPIFRSSETSVADQIETGFGLATRVSKQDSALAGTRKVLAENPDGISSSTQFMRLGHLAHATIEEPSVKKAWTDFAFKQSPTSIYGEFSEGSLVRSVFSFGKEIELPLRSAGKVSSVNFRSIIQDNYGRLQLSNDFGKTFVGLRRNFEI